MLAVVGYNFSRFQLSIDDPRERARAVLRSIGRVAVPAVAFVAVCMVLVGGYGLATLGLVNNYFGPPTHHEGRWHYWFIEAVVQVLVVVTAVLAVPSVRRFERRRPYVFALLLVGARTGAARVLGRHRRLQQPALPDPRRRLVLPARLARPPLDDDPAEGGHDGRSAS